MKQLGEARKVVRAVATSLFVVNSAGDVTVSVARLVSGPVALVATLTMIVMVALEPALTEPREPECR